MKRNGRIVAALFAWLVLGGGAAHAGTSERVVTDRFTGLAIGGYDPVAYFTDAAAREGRADLEFNAGSAVWRFRNDGNRAAFVARQDVYAPQFGGYDPVDVARGVARAGQPQIWLVAEQRLYLFGDEENRESFAASLGASRKAALDAWPAVEKLLAR